MHVQDSFVECRHFADHTAPQRTGSHGQPTASRLAEPGVASLPRAAPDDADVCVQGGPRHILEGARECEAQCAFSVAQLLGHTARARTGRVERTDAGAGGPFKTTPQHK